MDWKKFRGREDEEEFQKYHSWKQDYEKKANRSYKWPVMSVLLQASITKVVLSKREPDDKFIEMALQFLQVLSSASDPESYKFEFDFPKKNPFNSNDMLTLVESMKVFSLVKSELATYLMEAQKRYMDKRQTNAERYGFKRFKDRVKYNNCKLNAATPAEEDETDLATEARLEAQRIVNDLRMRTEYAQ